MYINTHYLIINQILSILINLMEIIMISIPSIIINFFLPRTLKDRSSCLLILIKEILYEKQLKLLKK